jgi:hypothetical protein
MSSKDTQFPLAELATSMMREVFQSITDSATEQLDRYATLVSKASLAEDEYLAEILGATPEARTALAEKYIREVVLPILQIPASSIPDPALLSTETRAGLISMFDGLVIPINAGGVEEERTLTELITPSGGGSFPWAITRGRLTAAVRAKLEKDARGGQNRLRTMLKSGLPQVNVTGGQICAKVTLATTETGTLSPTAAAKALAPKSSSAAGLSGSSLGLSVRVANEKSASFTRSQELIGSVKIDFRVGTFPPIDAAKG